MPVPGVTGSPVSGLEAAGSPVPDFGDAWIPVSKFTADNGPAIGLRGMVESSDCIINWSIIRSVSCGNSGSSSNR